MSDLKITENHLNGTATKTLTVSLNEEQYRTLTWFVGCNIEPYEAPREDVINYLYNWANKEDMDNIKRTMPDRIRFVKR